MGRLRSMMLALGATAAVICALSLAGPSPSHAAPPDMPGTDDAGAQPCNEACKAYMAWSDRVSARFHPSQPVAQSAAHDAKPAGQVVVRHRATQARQPSLNSFAQFPVRRAATAQSAETAQAAVAPSRPVDGIADRFPTTAGFVSAILASTAGAPSDAPESAAVSVTDVLPATGGASTIDATTGGLDIQFAVSLFLTLCILSGLMVWGWSRVRAIR